MVEQAIERTDKYQSGYVSVYENLSEILGTGAAVCEIGVFQGGSLILWQQLFPDSPAIVGVDIDPMAVWPQGTVQVVAQQDDLTLPTRLHDLSPSGYDLIVDDASHLGPPTYRTFCNLWPLVKSGGFYVIEDWCVGFPNYSTYDDSMLAMAMGMLNLFEDPDGDVHSIGYSYGMIVTRKK